MHTNMTIVMNFVELECVENKKQSCTPYLCVQIARDVSNTFKSPGTITQKSL